MAKDLLTEEESNVLATDMFAHFYPDSIINQDILDRIIITITASLEKIVEQRNKPKDSYPYLITEAELRTMFEEQHYCRDLTRSHRGTYRSVQIAAIWNQHVRSTRAIEQLLRQKLQGNGL